MKVDLDPANNVKYTLRTKSLLKRIESERTRHGSKKKEPKEKQKPPPLSKYRRKTANARERNRMKEINEAFETLQKTLPDLPGPDADKLTKITVLKLAVNYIKILSCVIDEDVIVPKDIDELREMWSLKNAHMTRPEHCVRSVFKSTKQTQLQNAANKPTKVVGLKQKQPKPKAISNNNKFGEVTKDRNGNNIKKRTSKPHRTRGKICKTASVATSNGAYITLKNVAFQNPASRGTHLDNRPLMMSMTVKRPRLEPMSYQRPPKFSRYEPPSSLQKSKSKSAQSKYIAPKPSPPIIKTEPMNMNPVSVSSFTPMPTIESISLLPPFNLSSSDTQITSDKFLPHFTLYDLDNPFIKSDPTLKHSKIPCTNSSCYGVLSPSLDASLCCSDESLLSSPKSPTSFSFPTTGASSPYSNSSRCSFNSVSPSSFTFSDSDSGVLAPCAAELEGLLGPESFQEELDHLTSSFVEDDDPLNLFLEQTTNLFSPAADMSGY